MSEEPILNLGQLLGLVIRNFRKILLWMVLAAAVALGATALFGKTRYQSSAVFYVSNAQQVENLEDSFAVVLKSRQTLMEVLRLTGMEMNHTQLGAMVRTSPLQDTHFFQVVVTGPNPYEARTLAEAIGQVLPRRIESIMEGTRAVVADEPLLELEPCGPNYAMTGILGSLAGLTMALMGILWKLLLPERKKPRP